MISTQMIVTAIIIGTSPVGDYDKRIVLFTRELGKITAFVKGAKRQKSKFLSATEQFSFGEFSLVQGRDAYSIIDANIKNYFIELRQNIDRLYYGFYFSELIDYFIKENIVEVEALKLLYQSLRALCLDTIPYKLIRYVFELRLISIIGIMPNVYECMECHSKENLKFFSVSLSGTICDNCKRANRYYNLINISDGTIYTMKFIISTPIEKLYSFKVKDNILKELSNILNNYLNENIDREIKTLRFLKS